MAVNSSRSMNQDFRLGGQIDGKVKVLAPDRGGVVDESSVEIRAHQLQPQYNIADMYHTYAENCRCSSCV